MYFIQRFCLSSFLNSFDSYLCAFIFGALIGAERQWRQRTAGIRTNALVALGAAAFVDLSQELGGDSASLRVIAAIVSGVGFLGAGTIMKTGTNILGLNTAATLWCSAAIGACAGSDMIAESALLTIFILIANTILRRISIWVDRPARRPSRAADESPSNTPKQDDL